MGGNSPSSEQGSAQFKTPEEEHRHRVRNLWQKIVFLRNIIKQLLDAPGDSRACALARAMVAGADAEYEEWKKQAEADLICRDSCGKTER